MKSYVEPDFTNLIGGEVLMHIFAGGNSDIADAGDFLFAVVATAEFDPWQIVTGDVTGDGSVTQAYIDIILANMGKEGAELTLAEGDVNGDGVIDALDLAIALDNLGAHLIDVTWGDGGEPIVMGLGGEEVQTWRRVPIGSSPICDLGNDTAACCCPCAACPTCCCCGPPPPGDPCDSDPCGPECEDRFCNPACDNGSGTFGDCHPNCDGSECDPECDHFDPCNEECSDDGDGNAYGPCHPDCDTAGCNPDCSGNPCVPTCEGTGFECHESCNPECNALCAGSNPCDPACESSGGGPCGENCPSAGCNPSCEGSIPCDPTCESFGGGPCSSACGTSGCNPACGGDPCAPSCAGSGFDCCEVDLCKCPLGGPNCCNDGSGPGNNGSSLVCVGKELNFCAPSCPNSGPRCDGGCEPGIWTWSGGDSVEFPDGNEGSCVTVLFTEPGEVSLQASNGCCGGKREFIAVTVRLDAVTFGGNNRHVARDTTGAPYPIPHWLSARAQAEYVVCNTNPDDCCDGQWEQICEDEVQQILHQYEDRQHPMAYTRSTSPEELNHVRILHVTLDDPLTIFHIDTGDWAIDTVTVRKVVARPEAGATPIGTWDADDNVPLPLVELANDAARAPHKYRLSMPIELKDDEGGALPQTIAYHEGMTTEWMIEINDREITVCDPMRSENTLYVTLANPQVSPLYHTVVHRACKHADGKNTEQDAINGIWNYIKGMVVQNFEDEPAEGFGYWRDPAGGCAVMQCLITGFDGQCGAWAFFMRDVLRVHGISATANQIVIDIEAPGMPPGALPHGIWVKNYDTSSLPPSSLPGVPGQGGVENPRSLFEDHGVTVVGGIIYDPSYGTDPVGSLAEWQRESLDAISIAVPGSPPGYSVNSGDSWPLLLKWGIID